MEETRIRLITRGDDCGSSQTANEAILEACNQGILKNVSLMATCSEIEAAAKIFADRQDICFGLHTTINAEWDKVKWGPVLPADQVSSLVDKEGYFFQTTQALHDNQPVLNEIMAEIQAQLNLLKELGFNVQYADQHMGFGWVLAELNDYFDQWCQKEGLLNNNKYARRLPDVEIDGDMVEELIAKLESAKTGQFLVVGHPGYDNHELRDLGHLGYPGEEVACSREWQRRIFTDPRIIDYCKNNEVEVIRYDQAEALKY